MPQLRPCAAKYINKNKLKYIYIKLRIVRQGDRVGKKYSVIGNNLFLFSFNVHCNIFKSDSQDGLFTKQFMTSFYLIFKLLQGRCCISWVM